MKIRQAPSLMVHRAAQVVGVTPVDGLRAIDQQCLQHRRAVGTLQPLSVKFLHQCQHAADRRGCHAGARLVTILVAKIVVQFFQRISIGLCVGGGNVIFPVTGPGRNQKRTGRNQIWFEPSVGTLNPDAHVAPAREGGHLVIRIGHAGKRGVGCGGDHLFFNLFAVLVDLRDGVRHAGDRLALNIAAGLNGAHCDDVLGRARRGDGAGTGVEAVVGSGSGVAGRKHVNHLLVAGAIRQRIARGRVVAGGRPRVVVLILVLPTVVGNQHIDAGFPVVVRGRCLGLQPVV